jgi:hypothetical protein
MNSDDIRRQEIDGLAQHRPSASIPPRPSQPRSPLTIVVWMVPTRLSGYKRRSFPTRI